MSIKVKIKRGLYLLLATETIGRLSRKIAYLLMKIMKYVYHLAITLHHNLPYVRELETQVSQNELEVLTNYYTQLANVLPLYAFKPKLVF